jgi:cytochrome P450
LTVVEVTYPFDTPAGCDIEPAGLKLLAEGPMALARMDGMPVWLALGYDVVRQVLIDQRFSRAAAVRPGGPITNQAGANPELLVSMDPPRHTDVRRLMAAAFSPRMVQRLQPRIVEIVDGLLENLELAGKPGDLVHSLAEPLPIMVICELLGVPDVHRAQIREWAGVLIAETAHTPSEIATAITEVDAYLEKLIALRRTESDDSLISALIDVNDEHARLSPTELTTNVQLLLIAGHETTVSQIGNCAVTLFQHPLQADLLVRNPELLPRAVDEMMRRSRLTTSTLPRVATEDVSLGGVTVRAGEAVLPLVAVANRDPSAFPEPDRFDITRIGPAPPRTSRSATARTSASAPS